ncbi:unnamed protein product [Phytophthora lilii]|uniref:Unnamed protein product n=1 Tax=Phytophthora lilii TaxID=2077276 RepID=A0A9W6WV41_9STRA|nr:unnamed protein product [Phytophthora lilii]
MERLARKVELGLQLASIRSRLVKEVCGNLLRIVKVTGRDFQDLANVLLPQIVNTAKSSSAAIRRPGAQLLAEMSKSVRSERVDEFVDMPSTQSKRLLIDEHSNSPLAMAILKKYPELANKLDTFTRSRNAFMRSRSNSNKSPRHKQNIEIHVPATPPPKQFDQKETILQDSANSELVTRHDGSVTTTERTRREDSSVSRRLFNETNIIDGPDDKQKSVPEAFDGSQMHEFQSQATQPNLQRSFEAENSEIPSRQAAIPGRASVARASSASSVEDAMLRHPGAKKLQESKIPSPLTRSPSLRSRKYLESPTRATSSPEFRPSLLPRPGSFTLKARKSSNASTPSVEEDHVEPNPLSASDEYFSKPIPSSIGTPTPPPPSTDNVTLRPRRQMFTRQEQMDSSQEKYSSVSPAFNLATEQESIQVQQEEAEMPRHTDYTSDDVDELSHLTDGSEHAEFDNEWDDHQRLDDSASRSENNSGSVQEDDIQSNHSRGNIFSDQWRLDEGPQHKFDLEDEIGDHLSDEEAGSVGETEDETLVTRTHRVSEMEWQISAMSSPKEKASMQSHFQEEAKEDKEQTKANNLRQDALEGLLSVRNEMARLRAVTRNDNVNNDLALKERFDSADSERQSPVSRGAQPWEAGQRKEPSFLERLKIADRFARSPLQAPPSTPLREQPEETGFLHQSSPLQTLEGAPHHTTAFDITNDRSEENEYLNAQAKPTSLPPTLDKISAQVDEGKHEPFDFVKDFGPAENTTARSEESTQMPQGIEQPHDLLLARDDDDQAGRFDAAEKLFAGKEVAPPHAYYDRPQSPDPELYMHSEPYRERFPPTQMGAKLNPANIVASTNVAPEDTTENIKALEEVNTSTGDPEEHDPSGEWKEHEKEHEGVDLYQPVLKSDDAAQALPPADRSHGNNVSTENFARLTSNPTTAVPERRTPPVKLGWAKLIGISVAMFLAGMFCIAGIMRAVKTVRDSHEYHMAFKSRIAKFEASIAESHEKVLKLEEDYAIWSEYVRKLTEEDEANALTQLEAIQLEVQKWQQEMKADLVQFRQALSVDSIEAAFADLRVNNTKQIEQ